jgi:hypothetical protein
MIDFNVRDYMRLVLPTGRYTVEIKKAILKTNKDGNRMVNLMLKVVSEIKKGAVIFSNYNVYHSKEEAAEMARVKFSQLCHVVGLDDIKNIYDLEGKIFDAQISESSYNGNPTNNVDSHHEASGGYARISEAELMMGSPPPHLNDDIPF